MQRRAAALGGTTHGCRTRESEASDLQLASSTALENHVTSLASVSSLLDLCHRRCWGSNDASDTCLHLHS